MSKTVTIATMADMLGRASQALTDWAETVTQIEAALDIARLAELDASQRVAVQSIDLLAQRLDDLALFLGGLAQIQAQLPEGTAPLDVDHLLDHLRLHDLRLHLAGCRIEKPAASERFALF